MKFYFLANFDKQDFNSKDFNAYLMSEKLDGVRGIWDGKYLKTRQNYKIKTPDFFTKISLLLLLMVSFG